MRGDMKMSKTYGLAAGLKSLIIAYIVTGLALFGLAFAMYKLGLNERTVEFAITFIYIFASAVGGLVMGKHMKQRKFLWGCLIGLCYALIIFGASVITAGNGQQIAADGMSTFLLCVGGGTLGGMIS